MESLYIFVVNLLQPIVAEILFDFCNQKLTFFVLKLNFLAAELHSVYLLVLGFIGRAGILTEQGNELFLLLGAKMIFYIFRDFHLYLVLLYLVSKTALCIGVTVGE